MHKICTDEGASFVETALTFSILMMLFFGAILVCEGLYTYHYVAELARVGTRYAMVRGSSCTSFASACPAASTDISTFVMGQSLPGINPANMTVTTTWPTTGSSCTPSSTPCNNPGNLVEVQVQYSSTLGIPFMNSLGLNLSSTSQVVIQQ